MADTPEVARAKARLKELVEPAVETLGELVESEHAGIRLGAAREILDRGGVPAKHDVGVHVDLTLDQEIEELIRGVRRQIDKQDLNIEDAELVDENGDLVVMELPLGEQAAELIGKPPVVAESEEVVEASPAWWQANPPGDDTTLA